MEKRRKFAGARGLTPAAPLRAARKNDQRIDAKHLVLVNVSQPPEVVAPCDQPFDSAWCVWLVIGATIGAGVQQTDIDQVA